MRRSKKYILGYLMLINNENLIIHEDINSSLIDFIELIKPTSIIIFTQAKVKSKANQILDNISENYNVDILILPNGERAKDFNSVVNSIKFLSGLNCDKEALLISLGGGSVSDHTGFVASIYKRGINYVNIPTTLIGMIDASIGGKTALNIDHVKNQIGTFYHPTKIFIHLKFIDSMSEQLLRDGYGEIFKYSILSDDNLIATFSKYLSNRQTKLLHDIIQKCCTMKINIVNIDERDQNIRKKLNLGHTFGHAIESESKNEISHGIAVVNGILMSSFLSYKNGYLSKDVFLLIEQIGDILINSKYRINNVDKYVKIMKGDKKNLNKKIGIIIIKSIGNIELQYFNYNEIHNIVEEYNEYISN